MSSKTALARPGHDRASLYDDITGKIIAELEAGRVPWVQPWGTAAAKAPLAMPKNAATGQQYSGINVLILWGAVIEHGFPAQSWLTFRQALSLGGNVRKSEHGTTVVYADRFVPDDEKRRARETGEEAAAIPFLKRFTVFNAAQCENLPAEVAAVAPPPLPGLIEPRVEALIRATGVDFRIGGNRAFYAPGPDFVMVPPPQAYFEPINWHRTALHELGHASGHPSRLGRDLGGVFGSKKYAFEELVALFRRPTVRYGRTPEPETPNQRAAQVWDDRIGSARVQAKNWRLMAFGSLALSMGLAGSLVWQSTHGTIVPWVVQVDKLGQAQAVAPAAADYTPSDPQVAWYLAHFIEIVRSLPADPIIVRQNWLQAYDFTTTSGSQALNDYARANDPFAKLGKQQIAIDVSSVIRASPSSFRVEWVEHRYQDGALADNTRWTAILTIAIQTPTSADVLRKNPLGIYVTAINWSKELGQ